MSHVLASVPTQVASQQSAIVSKEKPAITFIAAKHGHNARRRIEAFIASGFKARYNARVTSFMPMLFALDAKGVKAAAGARFATYDGQYNSLFIEQYLNTSVETALTLQG
ncbi:thermostable hemolysin, partial [Alteromonas mediterranea]|uniref:thermostable hemolysin n=2 Tax=Alteromonas TaxID=226 RepID=UPI00241D01EB